MATAPDVIGASAPDEFESDDSGREERILEAGRVIIGRLDRLAQEQITAKTWIEQRWLEDLRAYYGYYDPTKAQELKDGKRSRAFVKLTRHKTSGWAARLNDLLFPTDDRNWDIKPTPVPRLVKQAKDAQTAAAARVDEANKTADTADAQQDPAQAEMLRQRAAVTAEQANAFAAAAQQTKAEIEEAEKRCERMRESIEDQFIESDYGAQCRDVIEDGCRIGTGILKGPLTSHRLRSEWRKDERFGHWVMAEIKDPQPEYRRIDPWHFFPDMAARTIQEAEFSFERSLPTKKDLRKYALKLGFNKNAVRRLLREGPGAITGTDLTFLQNLRDLTGEGEAIKGRYVMWEYHGPLECEDIAALLYAAGQDELAAKYEAEADPLEEFRVIIHFCNNEVLKITPDYPLDSGASLYSVWNFEKGEASCFGIGVPFIMRDSQKALNGAWRMMMDNSGLSVGPQVVIDKNSVVPQDGDWGLRPLKVWLKSSTALHSANNKPFEIYNVPNNQQQLGGIIELAKQFADEETSLPQLAHGEQGTATNTLGGMSMLFNSATVMFRRVVKSFDDDLTKPTIRRAYDWNMQFNPDENVKGDMQVDARGTSVLLVREIQSVHMMNVVQNWSAHPVLGSYVKVRESMGKALQTLMIKPDELLYSEEEAKQRAADMAAATAQTGQDDSRLEVAKIESETRRYVADAARDTAMAELALREKLTIAEVMARFGIDKEKIASAERVKAVEISVEDKRAAEARADGQAASEGTGKEIG